MKLQTKCKLCPQSGEIRSGRFMSLSVGGVRTIDWLIIQACAINFMDNETKCNFIRFAIVGNNGSEMTFKYSHHRQAI